MTASFGDFLALANGHIEAVTYSGPISWEAAPGVLRELAGLTAVMVRCADAFVVPGQTGDLDRLDARARAVLETRLALHNAAARLREAAGAVSEPGSGGTHPATARLSAAAACLSAGHDLLQTHFAPGPFGSRVGDSPWAPVIASAPVTAALVAELAGRAGHLARWMLPLAARYPAGRPLPVRAQVALSASCHWLRAAEASASAAGPQPDMAAAYALLRSIPANVPPPRYLPNGGEQVPDLCAGITATAERLRYLTHKTASRQHRGAPFATSAWQRTAQGAAIAGHCTEMILKALAKPTASSSLPNGTRRAIGEAADAVRRAWQAWRTAAHQWDIFVTSANLTPKLIAAEIGDLVLWTGRLAHRNTDWTPAHSRVSPLRSHADLVSGTSESALVGTLLDVGDALTCIGHHDRGALRRLVAEKAVLVPTRLLPAECDVPYRYSPPLRSMTDTLIDSYEAAARASTEAVTALGAIASSLGSVDAETALLRSVSTHEMPYLTHVGARQPGLPTVDARPGHVEHALRDLGIHEPALLVRAVGIDIATHDLLGEVAVRTQRRVAAREPARQGTSRSYISARRRDQCLSHALQPKPSPR